MRCERVFVFISPFTMRSIILASLLLCLLCLLSTASAASLTTGSIEFFSDDACAKSILSRPNNIPRDVCLPASSGVPGKAFIVKEKPYCSDGSRPSLLLFQDCGCTDGIANYIPNARYGDYGNGSCTPLLGGDFVTFVLSCGEFKAPVRSMIEFSATFPSESTSTREVCGMGGAASTGTTMGTGVGKGTATTTGSNSIVNTGTVTGSTLLGSRTTTASTTKSGACRFGYEASVVCVMVFSVMGVNLL